MSFKGSKDYFMYLYEELGQVRYDYRVAMRLSRRYFDGLVMDAQYLAEKGVEKYSNKLAHEIAATDELLKPFDIFYEALEEEERLEQLLTDRKHLEREHKLLIALPEEVLNDIVTGFCWQTYALGRTCKHMNNLIHKIILSLDQCANESTISLCNELRATAGVVKDLRRDIRDALDGIYFDVTGNRYSDLSSCEDSLTESTGSESTVGHYGEVGAQNAQFPNTNYEFAPYEGPEVSNCYLYALDVYLKNEIRQALDKKSGHYGFSNEGRRVFNDEDPIEARMLNSPEKLLKIVKTRRLLRMYRTFIYVIQSFKYVLETASDGIDRVRNEEPELYEQHPDTELYDYIGGYMMAVDKYKRKGRLTPPADEKLMAGKTANQNDINATRDSDPSNRAS